MKRHHSSVTLSIIIPNPAILPLYTSSRAKENKGKQRKTTSTTTTTTTSIHSCNSLTNI
jgi:hypothetical protein